VLRWLTRHPRWTFLFTAASRSWFDAIETFFSAVTRRRLKRGSFHLTVDLPAAIHRYRRTQPVTPKRFTWTQTRGQLLAKLEILRQRRCTRAVTLAASRGA
jgi:hypothetical protein